MVEYHEPNWMISSPRQLLFVTHLYYLQPTWLGTHLWSVAFISFLSSHVSQSSSAIVFQPHSRSVGPPSMISTMISIWNWHWISFLSSVSVWGFKRLLNYARKSALSEDSKASNNFNSILKVVTLQLRNFLKVLPHQLWPFNGALSLLCLRCSFLKSYSVLLCRIIEQV